jgi:hypothetical protein
VEGQTTSAVWQAEQGESERHEKQENAETHHWEHLKHCCFFMLFRDARRELQAGRYPLHQQGCSHVTTMWLHHNSSSDEMKNEAAQYIHYFCWEGRIWVLFVSAVIVQDLGWRWVFW